MRAWIALAAIIAIGLAAAVDAFRGEGSEPSGNRTMTGLRTQLRGPELPPQQTLAGALAFAARGGCRVQILDLPSLTVGQSSDETNYRLWVSPRGDRAVASLTRPLGSRANRLLLVQLGSPPLPLREIGIGLGEVSWSSDGERVAWCREDSTTVVLALSTGQRSLLPGCSPSISPDGSVLTREVKTAQAALLRDGEPFLTHAQLARGFPPGAGSPVDIVGYDERDDGLLAVTLVRFETGRWPHLVLGLWRGQSLEKAIELPSLPAPGDFGRYGERVQFSPDGTAVAVAFPGYRAPLLVADVRTGHVVLPPTPQHGFAWSPANDWFALSTDTEILVYGAAGGEPAYAMPVEALSLNWR